MGFLKSWGIPLVTMGFNTQSWSNDSWDQQVVQPMAPAPQQQGAAEVPQPRQAQLTATAGSAPGPAQGTPLSQVPLPGQAPAQAQLPQLGMTHAQVSQAQDNSSAAANIQGIAPLAPHLGPGFGTNPPCVFHEGFTFREPQCEDCGDMLHGETNTFIKYGTSGQPVGGVLELIVVSANHKVNGYFIVCCQKWVGMCDDVPSKQIASRGNDGGQP